ncbi:MAG: phospho-N-acetylmuramoyl-pentapeptide-transferase [Bacillota bacterium]
MNKIFIFLASLSLSLFLGKVLIKKLKEFKFGQSIRKEGPKSHYEKSGTPTMGGLIFLISFLIIFLFIHKININMIMIILTIYGLGSVGFIDDLFIIKTGSNEGIKPKQKIFGQILVATIISILTYKYIGAKVYFPFFVNSINLGLLYIPFNIFFIIALSNSVNLTDGLDGLSTSVTIIVLISLLIPAMIFKNILIQNSIVILIGGLIAFLFYNKKPAKVFMGDVGSLALGGAVAIFSIILKLQFFIPFIGIIYFAESLSVIIQVLFFKKYNKRIFKMTPIHHHYELLGFKEVEIVKKFSFYTFLGSVLAIYMMFN